MRGREILTPADYARLSGRSKTTVIAWCERGILPALRIGSRWWLKRSELVRDGWLTARGSEGGDLPGARHGQPGPDETLVAREA